MDGRGQISSVSFPRPLAATRSNGVPVASSGLSVPLGRVQGVRLKGLANGRWGGTDLKLG